MIKSYIIFIMKTNFILSLLLLVVIFISGCTTASVVAEKCGRIEKQGDEDFCYSMTGIAKQDISYCDKIQRQNARVGCYDIITAAKQIQLFATLFRTKTEEMAVM